MISDERCSVWTFFLILSTEGLFFSFGFPASRLAGRTALKQGLGKRHLSLDWQPIGSRIWLITQLHPFCLVLSFPPVAFPRPPGLEPTPPHADFRWKVKTPKTVQSTVRGARTALPAGLIQTQSHKWCWSTEGRRLPVERSCLYPGALPAAPLFLPGTFTSSPRQDTESPTASSSKWLLLTTLLSTSLNSLTLHQIWHRNLTSFHLFQKQNLPTET